MSTIAEQIQAQRESFESSIMATLRFNYPSRHWDEEFAVSVLDGLLDVMGADETEAVDELPVADPYDTLDAAIRAMPTPIAVWDSTGITGEVQGWVVMRDHGDRVTVISGVSDVVRLRGVMEIGVVAALSGEFES